MLLEIKNFISKHKLENEDCIGFMAINNALYPDFISAEKEFDLKSQDYFKKFSKTLMSACAIHMAIFINKEIKDNVALQNEDIDFFTRLGSLAQMVGIKVIDILVRDKETGHYSSVLSQIVNVLNQKMSSTSGSDGLKNLQNFFKFIKL